MRLFDRMLLPNSNHVNIDEWSLMNGLVKEKRLQHILQSVQKNGQVNASALSQHFNVSEITIRRDLHKLADEGFVRLVYGGATLAKQIPVDPPIIQRMLEHKEEKEAIGLEASKCICDGDTVFIGSGSTTAYVARNLKGKEGITVVTNALNIGTELATNGDISVVVLGGLMRQSELSLIGHITDLSLKEIRIDKVIIGIPAIDPKAGLSNDYLLEVMTDRNIINKASELIVVADHSKFGKISTAYLAPIERVTTIVTDHKTDKSMLEIIVQLGIRVVVVNCAGENDSPMG